MRTKRAAASLASRLLGLHGWRKCERACRLHIDFAGGRYDGPGTVTAERDGVPDSPWSAVVQFTHTDGRACEICVTRSEVEELPAGGKE